MTTLPERRVRAAHPEAPALADLDDLLGDQLDQLPESVRSLMEQAADYHGSSRSKRTREGYGSSVDAFAAWLEESALPTPMDQPLPAHPMALCLYLAHLAETGGRHGDGRRPSTISVHLSAIRAMHVDAGQPDPTSHPDVRRVLSGIKRTKGTRRKQREPMVYAQLCRTIAAMDLRHELAAARDRVLLAAVATPVAGMYATDSDRTEPLSSTQLAALTWGDVEALEDGGMRLTVPSPSNRKTTVDVDVDPIGGPLCLVDAVTALLDTVRRLTSWADRGLLAGPLAATVHEVFAGRLAPVLVPTDRRGLPKTGRASRQFVDARLKRAGHAVGASPTRTTAPTWTPELRAAAVDHVQKRELVDVRDRAMLLLGWHLAARRSNLTWLRVGEVADHPQGLEVHFRRSKTDQEEQGRDVAVTRTDRYPQFCPVRAWHAWRAEIDRLKGPLAPEHPAFPPITKDGAGIDECREVFDVRPDGTERIDAGGYPVSLGLEGVVGSQINRVVKQRAKDAGLTFDDNGRRRPWGGHSLRRGWLTEGARQGISLERLMAHSGHVSHESVMAYIEASSMWDPEQSAPMLMSYDLN